ncbi:MAG TPA: chemotaxis protein CheC [Syntrophomonas sp.]|nr:chemotaxis protein CheC [Syntrophomonas sp.]
MKEGLEAISAAQIDALQEVANVGAGHAATALGAMLEATIKISVPRARIMSFADVSDFVGGAETYAVAVFSHVSGPVQASILLVMPVEKAAQLLQMLLNTGNISLSGSFTDMEYSALMELGNILSSSYLNALSSFTQMDFTPSTPALAMDMVGAVLDTILAQYGAVSDLVLLMETGFKKDNVDVMGNVFFLPEPESLDSIFAALGVAN